MSGVNEVYRSSLRELPPSLPASESGTQYPGQITTETTYLSVFQPPQGNKLFSERIKKYRDEIEFSVELEEGSLKTLIKAGGLLIISLGSVEEGLGTGSRIINFLSSQITLRVSEIIGENNFSGEPYKLIRLGIVGRLDEAIGKFNYGSIDVEEFTNQIVQIARMAIEYNDSEFAIPYLQLYVEDRCPNIIGWGNLPADIVIHYL